MTEDRQLVPTLDSNNIRNASEAYGAGLWRLLTDAGNPEGVRLIALNRTLRDENERKLPFLAARVAPMPQQDLMAVLVKHAVTFGVQARTDGEWATILGVYLDALSMLPAEAVDVAFERWHRAELYPAQPGRHAFMPKPAELYALAEPTLIKLRMALHRARKAHDHIERTKPREKTEADILAIQKMAAEFKTKAIPSEARRLGRSPHEAAEALRRYGDAQVGPSGLTPAMRALRGLGPETKEGPEDLIL
jgi:hypothetical protein